MDPEAEDYLLKIKKLTEYYQACELKNEKTQLVKKEEEQETTQQESENEDKFQDYIKCLKDGSSGDEKSNNVSVLKQTTKELNEMS